MIRFSTFVAFILFVFFSFESVLSKPKIWLESTPGLYGSAFIYHESGESVEIGTFGHSDINKLIQDNPTALELAEASNSYATSSAIWFIGSMVFLVGVFVPLFFFSSQEQGSEPNQMNTVLSLISVGSAISYIITALVSISKRQTSIFYLLRAINTYNGVYHRKKAFIENRSVLLSFRLGSYFF